MKAPLFLALGLLTAGAVSVEQSPGMLQDAYASIQASVGGELGPDGRTEVQLDLPASEHRKNVSSRGQGCCVQTSINYSARWQNIPALIDFQTWVQEQRLPGGAYPGAIDERIPKCCKDRGYPTVSYLQIEGKDLEILKAACASGRMPGVTYSFSPSGRYGGARISHMTTLVSAGVGADVGAGPDGRGYWVICDNNFPGTWEWLSEAEFLRTYAAEGKGWSVILLGANSGVNSAGPPLPPRN